jgi:aryl-alcohol dehydrogenase-like predicted oxidoreductase
MRMRTIALNGSGTRVSALGFGCSAMMGRVGRSASLAALAAAYDAGITFFDTARSYGYGESEALLGVFLQGRREAVVVSTKFGILPTPAGVWKRSLKPVARRLLKLAPGVRGAMQRQIAAQFSGGHFSVDALHASLETSLRALRTDYVDMLFLHEPPASVLQQEDLFATLERLVSAGKVRGFGIASSPAVMDAALACKSAGLHALQFPANLSNLSTAQQLAARRGNILTIANHPFGGVAGISATKTLLAALAAHPATPASLSEKLRPADDALIADVVLNLITREAGVQIVVPSMLRLDHLRANIAAMEHSRFSDEELHWLRGAIASTQPMQR